MSVNGLSSISYLHLEAMDMDKTIFDSPTERIITLRITSERITSERITSERINTERITS